MWWHAVQHWLSVHTGSLNEPGIPPENAFWAGFGSDLAEFALVGALFAMIRRHNCAVRRCWRLGRHVTAAQHWVCARHHPDGAPTHQNVIDAHNAASGKGEA